IANTVIALIYFVYLHLVAMDFNAEMTSEFINAINMIGDNLHLLLKSVVLVFYGSLAYGGLFLLIGFIGNRAFTIGVVVALFERFFLSLLFLRDQPYLPLTNLSTIAGELFSPLYTYAPTQVVPDFIVSQLYVVLLACIWAIAGLFLMRYKEFE
ncbi:MAG TPA: hypothetical protein VJ044_17345, partial [Candidatus Hodarchaeales archaeon]|nr:hypothetical protein [Candidatus Hodarchaeales archaeon]